MLDLVFGGRNLVFASPLSLEEATKRLQREITPPGVRAEWRRPMEWRMFEKRPQSFIGTFADGRFHMVRLVRGRGSIRPWMDGKLSRAFHGCSVEVRVKMPALAIIAYLPFMLLGLFALFSFGVLALWGLLVVLAPGIVWSMEARKGTTMLASLLEAEPSRAIAPAHVRDAHH
jgi:hypothetical protein